MARATSSPRLVEAAREVLVLVSGAGNPAPKDLPAVIAARAGATWLLDVAAAVELAQATRPET